MRMFTSFIAATTVAVVVTAAAAAGLTACASLTESSVMVDLPPIPDVWNNTVDIIGFRLIYPDMNAEPAEIVCLPDEEIVVELMKRNNVPVLAYPICKRGGTLRPAGALFPLHLGEDGKLLLSWYNGFSALLFSRLWAVGTAGEAVNSERLLEEIREKAPVNPWTLDLDSMVEAFSYSTFHSRIIDNLPVYDVVLTGRTGDWVVSDPFVRPVRADSGGTLTVSDLYPGMFHLYDREKGARIDIYIDEKEWYALNDAEGSTEYGSW